MPSRRACAAAVALATASAFGYVFWESYTSAVAADHEQPVFGDGKATAPREGRAASRVLARPPGVSDEEHFRLLESEETETLRARAASLRLIKDESFDAERAAVRSLLRRRGVKT